MERDSISPIYSDDGKRLIMLDDEFVKRFEVPQGVEIICFHAFSACSYLREIRLPDSLKKIEGWAFSGCRYLEGIYIPASVISIGLNCFSNCVHLVSLIVDNDNSAFKSVEGVLYDKSGTELLMYPAGKGSSCFVLPDGVCRIGKGAFEYSCYLEDVIIPPTVKIMEEDAFYGCQKLRKVLLSEGLSSIGDRVFSNCLSLEEVTLSPAVKIIGAYSFFSCSSMLNIKIPEGVEIIKEQAFSYCESLGEVYLPSTIRKLELYVFGKCKALKDIYILVENPDVLEVEPLFFEEDDVSDKTLHIPPGSALLYSRHAVFGQFSRIEEMTKDKSFYV